MCHQGQGAQGASGRRMRPEHKPTWKFLNPMLWACPQHVLTGIAAGTPPRRLPTAPMSPPGAASRLPPPAWGFWGELSCLGNQPHVPALACPALSRIPNPSHMVSISLGSAGACSAVSKLTFPCLSMQLLARDARPSPRPWSSPALPVRTRLSQPRGGCGEAGAGSCLYSALKLQPGRASGRLVPGEVPAPACLLFPWLCRRSALHPGASSAGMGPPAGWCRGQPQNVALSPQNVPRHLWSGVWARCHAKPRGLVELGCPGCSSHPVLVVLDLSGLS